MCYKRHYSSFLSNNFCLLFILNMFNEVEKPQNLNRILNDVFSAKSHEKLVLW